MGRKKRGKKGVRAKSPKTRKKRRASKKKHKVPVVCEHSMEGEDDSTMVLKCKGCPGPHDVEDRCLGAVLSAYSKEYKVKKITMSHYIEKEYYGEALTLFDRILDLANEIENLSLRDPAGEYFTSKGKKEPKKVECTRCSLNPNKLFSRLKLILLRDPGRFHGSLKTVVKKIPAFKKKTRHCDKCLRATIEDLNYVFDEYEKLVGFVVNNAFNKPFYGNIAMYPGGKDSDIINQYLRPLRGYQQSVGNTSGSPANVEMCNVCMFPLRGGEVTCPNCATRLYG